MDSLKADVAALAKAEGRKPGTNGHTNARRFLESRMAEVGLHPYRGQSFTLPYRQSGRDFFNLVGMLPGTDPTLAPVLLGAHYDSVISAPCADDNAAGVAIALAVAAELSAKRKRGTVFAFFDAEEPPYFLGSAMGSIRFYEDQMHATGIHAALIMDLVGHDVPLPAPLAQAVPSLSKALFITGAESHSGLANALAASKPGKPLPIIAAQNDVVGDLSDHHIFRVHGVPYLFLSCGRWQHYHMPSDTSEKLSYSKMAHITHFLTSLIPVIGDDALPKPSATDTTALEIQLFKEAVGPALPLLLSALGLRQLETRKEMDQLAHRLQSSFGL